MPSELYEILAQGAAYWFAFLGVIIVWRSFAWLRKDGRLRRKRVRQLPDAGLVGELVVLWGSSELPEGTLLPLPKEGVLGSYRGCDVTVPCPGVAGKHLTFRFENGKGLFIEPWVRQEALVDGEPVVHQGRPGLMYHGSRLQVGEAMLRMRLFVGVSTARSAVVQEDPPVQEPVPVALPSDWREQTLTHHQAIRPWQEPYGEDEGAFREAEPYAPYGPDAYGEDGIYGEEPRRFEAPSREAPAEAPPPKRRLFSRRR